MVVQNKIHCQVKLTTCIDIQVCPTDKCTAPFCLIAKLGEGKTGTGLHVLTWDESQMPQSFTGFSIFVWVSLGPRKVQNSIIIFPFIQNCLGKGTTVHTEPKTKTLYRSIDSSCY